MSDLAAHIEKCQDEAITLTSLLFGASELLYAMQAEPSPTRDALSALLTVMGERAEKLAAALERVNRPKA